MFLVRSPIALYTYRINIRTRASKSIFKKRRDRKLLNTHRVIL